MATLYITSKTPDQVIEITPQNGEEFSIGEIIRMIGRHVHSYVIQGGKVVFLEDQRFAPNKYNKAIEKDEDLFEKIRQAAQFALYDSIKGDILVCSWEEAGGKPVKPAICGPFFKKTKKTSPSLEKKRDVFLKPHIERTHFSILIFSPKTKYLLSSMMIKGILFPLFASAVKRSITYPSLGIFADYFLLKYF